MYVIGEADAFSIGRDGQPVVIPVSGGTHFYNSPGAPHALEIAFIAITPRNLREDTQAVSDEVKAAYKRVVGIEAPLDV
jgi:hypothetical protein